MLDVAAACALALGGGIGLVVGGCAGPLNQSSRLGDPALTPPIDTLEPTLSGSPDYSDPAYTPVRLADGASLNGMDRSNWSRREFMVPVHTVEHQPNYTYHAQYTKTSARQRGEYPTADTALEKFPPPWNMDQPAEAAMGPIWSALDIVMFLPRAVGVDGAGPPWSTTQSPRWAYERTQRDRARSSETPGAPMPDDDSAQPPPNSPMRPAGDEAAGNAGSPAKPE